MTLEGDPIYFYSLADELQQADPTSPLELIDRIDSLNSPGLNLMARELKNILDYAYPSIEFKNLDDDDKQDLSTGHVREVINIHAVLPRKLFSYDGIRESEDFDDNDAVVINLPPEEVLRKQFELYPYEVLISFIEAASVALDYYTVLNSTDINRYSAKDLAHIRNIIRYRQKAAVAEAVFQISFVDQKYFHSDYHRMCKKQYPDGYKSYFNQSSDHKYFKGWDNGKLVDLYKKRGVLGWLFDSFFNIL